MKFPVQLTTIGHKHGGKITRITGLGHQTDKPQDGRSRDYWFFKGAVEWQDGTKSGDAEIPPWALCCSDPGDNPELAALFDAMNNYLREHGQWCERGPHEGWYADRKVKLGPVHDSTGRLMASTGPQL